MIALPKTPQADFPDFPHTRGRIRANADLSKTSWFGVGGAAEFLFRPEDEADLALMLSQKPAAMPLTVLGAASNVIIRDGGIEGLVIRLGKGFAECTAQNDRIIVGAASLSFNAASLAQQNGIGGLEFLVGIPGSMGGVLRMNGGAYGTQLSDVLIEAHALDEKGGKHILSPEQLHYTYRHCGLPEGWIFTGAVLQGKKEQAGVVKDCIDKISAEREKTQPIRSKTGGSTFKNPEGYKAWQLVDAAGCRGLMVGGAQMSELHCNFMVNTGNATAADLENLGEEVRRRVFEKSGIQLEWEIKRIGQWGGHE
jgi:UDP-N-acetylmuramate dehydrogenase